MNPTISSFIISVAGAIIMFLLGAVVYFLKKWIESTDSLTRSVNDLKTAVALLQSNQTNSSQSCVTAHAIIDKRLNAHSDRLNEHEKEITELKAAQNTKRGMRNTIPILILSLFLFTSATPTRVRVADKAEYTKYLAWCNEVVPQWKTQEGKITLKKVNGQYTDSLGRYTVNTAVPTYWYKTNPTSITLQPWELLVARRIKVVEKRRSPSVRDFYEWWLTNKYLAEIKRIEEELASGRMSPENAELLKLDLAAVKAKLKSIQ